MVTYEPLTSTLNWPQAAADRHDGARRTFFRIFNATSIALVFWVCFVEVLSWLVRLLPLVSFQEWVMLLAYWTRQHLISGAIVLLAVALGAALLPERLNPRVRWLTMFALLLTAAAVSAAVRFVSASEPMKDPREIAGWLIETVVFWSIVGLIAYGLVRSIQGQVEIQGRLGRQIAEQTSLTAAALEARLTVLQAQIEPHFLFNTLANVRRLCEVDPERGQRMLASLLDYLRAALPAMRRSSTALAEEFALVRAYLSVLEHRMGERLRFKVELTDQVADAQVPPLILPTLVENAIRHGLGPLPEGGTITVGACRQDGQIVMTVTDDGAGFQGTSGTGVGLANTRARLAALFGSAASLTLRSNQPRGVVAEVRLPHLAAAANR